MTKGGSGSKDRLQIVPPPSRKRNNKTKYCTKRGPGNKIVQSVPVFSVNCAGCNNKVKSLVDNVNHVRAGTFSLQETHFKRKGRLNEKFPDFQLFETIRKKQKPLRRKSSRLNLVTNIYTFKWMERVNWAQT